jgi:hypothetical protein
MLATALGGLGSVAAGCGAANTPGVAALGTTTASEQGASTPVVSSGAVAPDAGSNPAGGPAAAFDACLRTHGLPDQAGPSVGRLSTPIAVEPNSPQFAKATKACVALLPEDAPPALVSHPVGPLLAFAKCMRSRGVAGFPDPTSRGLFEQSAMAGIDPNSPIFQTAIKTCRPLADNEPLARVGATSP